MPIVETDWVYVERLLTELRQELRGLHERIEQVESVRYLEDKIALAPEEQTTGIELRLGATGELVENVKAALTANPPQVVMEALRPGSTAKGNSSKREKFWSSYLLFIDKPEPVKGEVADGQAGAGVAVMKAVYAPWPKKERRRLNPDPSTGKKETDKDLRARQKALKRKWGPPFAISTVHPLSFFFRIGPRRKISEAIEHGYKSRRDVFSALGIGVMPVGEMGALDAEGAGLVAGTLSMPTEDVKALPKETDTSTMILVTEYWRAPTLVDPGLYQCYVNGQRVYSQEDPPVAYFLALGRTTSSKDPDKIGLSVAEILSKNEPAINRTLTRMAEAAELLVHPPMTIETPEGGLPMMMEPPSESEDNSLIPRSFSFDRDKAEALPPGSKVVRPFEGAEEVYQAMPMVELMLRLMGQHGVSPIFKGVSPGASGSGYRDNSLYLMARSQFQYLLDGFAGVMEDLITWCEDMVVRRVRQEVFCYDQSLKPSDIKPYPVVLEVMVEPQLPQNLAQLAQFYDRMHSQGHITRRMVLEKGMKEQQPEQIIKDKMLEDLQQAMMPQLFQDVLMSVGAVPPPRPQLVDGQGNPIRSNGGGGGGGNPVQALLEAMGGGSGEAAQAAGGFGRGGQPRQPPERPGALPDNLYVEGGG